MSCSATIPTSSGSKRIVIMTNRTTVDCHDRLRGIERYLGRMSDWDRRFIVKVNDLTGDVVRREVRRGADGFIVDISVNTDVLDALAMVRVPVVTIDVRGHPICSGKRNVRTVCCDDEGVARVAAHHFLDQERFHAFAFVRGDVTAHWARIRERTYVRMLADRGIYCHLFNPVSAADQNKALVSWLRKLPKPVAVMAVNDDMAAVVLQAVRDAKLRVPQTVAVLGSDNDELVCRNTRPTISSVAPNFEEEGYRAARILHALMRGDVSVPRTPVFVAVRSIVVRESTESVSQVDLLVRRARRFIEKNACKGIDVEDVARYLGVSRRLVYLRFKEAGDLSPSETIRSVRLEAVCRRLRTTRETIGYIAAECGFESETHLMRLFKRRFGMTMRAFRALNRPVVRKTEDRP